MNGTKTIYADSPAFVRIKGGESKCFWIESGVRQGCIVSPRVFNVHMDEMMKEVKKWE